VSDVNSVVQSSTDGSGNGDYNSSSLPGNISVSLPRMAGSRRTPLPDAISFPLFNTAWR
jgi:hypothetical protein